MSRAFVKEDAEPAPIHWRRASTSEGPRLLTRSGASRLKDELTRLKATPDTLEAGPRIAQLEEVLATSEIVDVRSGTQVTFGATVVLREVESGTEVRYQLVGEPEADLREGRLSISSPLARALIGREVGELVQVQRPTGVREYELCALGWDEPER